MRGTLKNVAMVLGFIAISWTAAVEPCLAEDGPVEAVWRHRPVVEVVDVQPAVQHQDAVSESDRQQNGCPAASGLSPRRWICLTLPEAREVDVRLAVLEGRLTAALSKKPRRLGFSLACSVGAALDATGEYGLVPPSCGVYYGFAFRLGK